MMSIRTGLLRYRWRQEECYRFLWGEEEGRRRQTRGQRIRLIGAGFAILCFPVGRIAGNSWIQCVFLFVLVLALLLILPDWLLQKKVGWKRYGLEMELPDFLDRTAMLLSAGLSLPAALDRASALPGEGCPLSQEVSRAMQTVALGRGIASGLEQALTELSARCRSPAVSLAASYFIQNMQKGSEELAEHLRQQAMHYRGERKHLARKQGEEASALLLLPTTMIFAVILLMLVAPAIMQLSW